MHIRCPHCRQDNQVADDSEVASVTCDSCGSTFSLYAEDETRLETEVHGSESDSDRTKTYRHASKTIGNFTLVERLGMGSFGAVWKAKDPDLDRTVAVKIPRKGQLSQEETEAFLREARAAGQLRHPNIVSVYQVGVEDGVVYIVSDYIDGATLADWMSVRRPSSREVAELCTTIADALEHAHEQGVIHRDLKPGNIMMDLENTPHLMDFGLARREAGEVTVTVEGQVLGTPAYMSPEQARGESHTADQRSDIYSLGVVLFQLLTGELPFRGSARMLIVQIMQDDAPSLRKLSNHVPVDLETICLKCLEKEPDRRYQSASEVSAELRRFVSNEPIHARPISSVDRMFRWCRRRPALASVSAMLAIVTVLGFAGITWQWRRAEDNFKSSQVNLQEANTQRARAEENLQVANEQRELADERFELARTTVRRALTQVPNHELLQKPGMEAIRVDLQALACEYYTKLAAQQVDDPVVKMEQGQAHFFFAMTLEDIGKPDEAMEQYELARDALIDAQKRQATVGPDDVMDRRLRQNLTAAYGNIAGLKMIQGNALDAIESFEGILEMQRQLMKEQPTGIRVRIDVIVSLMNLSFIERDMNKPEAALARNAEALELTKADVPVNADDGLDKKSLIAYQPALYIEVGHIEKMRGNYEASLDGYRNAVEVGRRLVHDNPDQVGHRHSLGIAERGAAGVLAILEKYAEAEEMFAQAVATHEYMYQKAPDVVEYKKVVGDTFENFSIFWNERNQPLTAFEWSLKHRQFSDGRPQELFDVASVMSTSVGLLDNDLDSNPNDALTVKRNEIADHAIATLKQAISAGFNDSAPEKLKLLGPISSHADYEDVLMQIAEAKQASENEASAEKGENID